MRVKTVVTGMLACLAGVVFGQGSLTPPGAPAPTMKTLDQVEPRTAISSLPYTITQPGSYYVSKDLTSVGDGITIAADNVTLNLMGFTLTGTTFTSGILGQSVQKNIVIKNGYLRNWGEHGICLNGVIGVVLKDLSSTDNGNDGFAVGANTLVTDCVASGNGDDGFSSDGGSNRFVRCRSQDNEYGFYMYSVANQLNECEALGCSYVGIHIKNDSVLEGNTVIGNGSYGVQVVGIGSYIANNIVKGNANNYSLSQGNQLNILLCEIPETISWPCSVKFAGTLICTNKSVTGITVAANDVTIDMNGHTLVGPGVGSWNGIYQGSTYRNLTVKNGKVIRWEAATGIKADGIATVLSDLQVSTNNFGVFTATCGTIKNCTAYNNSNCGIEINFMGTIDHCVAYGNGIRGISAHNGGKISGCTAYKNGTTGIGVYKNTWVVDCICDDQKNGTVGYGIYVSGGGNRIDNNSVTDNDYGIYIYGAGNFIVRNTAKGNTHNYSIVGGNNVGTIQTSPVGAGAWDNFEF